MKILWLCAHNETDSFEKAVFDLPFKNYLENNKIEYAKYDYFSQEKTLKKFNNEYASDNSFDFIVVPVSENDFQQIDFTNKTSKAQIIYIITGDAEELKDVLKKISIRDEDDTTIVTLENSQNRYIKNPVFINRVKLNYFVNEYIFNKDSDYENKNIDVCFFGSKTPKREKLIDEIKKSNINITCYGDGWEFPRHNLNFEKNVLNRSLLTVITDGKLKPLHLEAIACGSLPVVKKCNQYMRMFKEDGDELPIYENEEDLPKLLKYHLDNKDRIKQIEIRLNAINKKYGSDAFFKKLFKKI